MALRLWTIIEALVLLLNACAILNDRRFLAKHGLDKPAYGEGLRFQISLALYTIRTYLRLPLVGLNAIVILVEALFG